MLLIILAASYSQQNKQLTEPEKVLNVQLNSTNCWRMYSSLYVMFYSISNDTNDTTDTNDTIVN